MIKTGNVKEINSNNPLWFLGGFIDDPQFNTKDSHDFEVKLHHLQAGETYPLKQSILTDPTCKSMVICVYGNFIYSFLQDDETYGDYQLDAEGEYVFWTPDTNHQVVVYKDSVALTVRWYETEQQH
ncbi:hypothetical protein KC614_04395 [candidate division WWE3 bacterium]|uniref:Uncharacterized protein n=1 Tax=candidate division WWE3 bacterium TaxID=2053526 RepID=A0A955LLF0_UNCKA|nr:hypothetical protein [candidate division WWE3 bacterium]